MAHLVSHFCFMAVQGTALFLSHFLRPFLHSFAVVVVFDFKALKRALNRFCASPRGAFSFSAF
jgi:hypothetical protein